MTGAARFRQQRARAWAAALVIALGAAMLGACSSSTAPSSSPSTASSSTAPSNTAAATAQITANWQAFFSKSTPLDQRARYLQNGSAMGATLKAFSGNPLVSQVTAKVDDVTVTSPTTATVTYDILGPSGTPLESHVTGKAVEQNGTWVVSDQSLCSLLSLTGTTPTGCA